MIDYPVTEVMGLREVVEQVHQARARLTATREQLSRLDEERTRVEAMTQPAQERGSARPGRKASLG